MEKVRKHGGAFWVWMDGNDFGFLALLALIWAVFHRHVLFDGRTFVLTDASELFYPLWDWGARVWNQGRIPLWNPDAGFGNPYLSNPQNACWYPPLRLFYFFLSPVAAFNACLLSHHLFATLGFYLFSQGRKISKPASFLGAVLFGYSLHGVSSPCSAALMLVLAWIPWVFLALDRLFNGRRGSIFFLSLSIALQMAAGYPIVSYLTLLAAGVEKLFSIRISPSANLKKWVFFFVAFLWGLAFNLAWLIPFAEFARNSNTSQRLDFHVDLSIQTLGTWLNPFFIFHPLYSTVSLPFELTCYFMGLPVLGLILWGGFSRRLPWIPLLLTALGVVLSLGGLAGKGMEHLVPLYHWVARSGYWMSLVVFSMAYLASLAIDRKIQGEDKKKMDGKWMMAGILVYVFALWAGAPANLTSFWISAVLFLLLGLVQAPCLRSALLAGSILFSLFPAAQGVNFTMPRGYYENPPPLCRYLTEPGRVYISFNQSGKYATVHGDTLLNAYTHLKNGMIANWPLVFNKEECFFYNSFFLKDYFAWCFTSMQRSEPISRKVLDYLSVRYVLGSHHFPRFQWSLRGEDPGPLSQNLTPMSKWNSVTTAIPQSDFSSDLDKIGGKDFSFERQCFISDPALVGSFTPRKVREIARLTGRVQLEAPGMGRGLLVSSEMAYPGWRGWDERGEPVSLVAVNHGFRGVVLAEGQKSVTLSYEPMSFRLGCFLSLLACALWAGRVFCPGKDKNFQ